MAQLFAENRIAVAQLRESKAHVMENYHVAKITGGHGAHTAIRRRHERHKVWKAAAEHHATDDVHSLKPNLHRLQQIEPIVLC